ncbi:hypothetical protein MPTK1_2g03255 [Marchantia polymorpha subsp. ruderalis]
MNCALCTQREPPSCLQRYFKTIWRAIILVSSFQIFHAEMTPKARSKTSYISLECCSSTTWNNSTNKTRLYC